MVTIGTTHIADSGVSSVHASRFRRRLPARALAPASRPIDDAVFERFVGHVVFGIAHASAHRDARLVHGVGIARDERMPPVKVLALVELAVGAGGRQPFDLVHHLGGEPHAIVDLFAPMSVIAAAAALAIEQPAADVGEIGRRRVLVLELDEAAAAAAVAQAFPFRVGHLGERFAAPERRVIDHEIYPVRFISRADVIWDFSAARGDLC